MSNRRALVIGGSLGGLIAAHLLRSVGWDAVVFERNAEELASRGVGLGTHPQLIDILRARRHRFRRIDGHHGRRRSVCLDRDGTIVLERPTARTMSGWARLYRALRDALPARELPARQALVRVEQDADGVTAVFADGTRERGDLLVGADGMRSTVRAQFLPEAQPHLCRLRRVARAARRARRAARHPRARCSSSTRSACPRASSSSAIRCRAATTTPRSAGAPTTSSGTGRPIARDAGRSSAPTRPAAITPPAFRRR